MNKGTADNCKFNGLYQCVYLPHVVAKDDPFVYRVQVTDDAEEWVYYLDFADYAALKAAWHPSQLTGAQAFRCCWSGHGHGLLQWRARCCPLSRRCRV